MNTTGPCECLKGGPKDYDKTVIGVDETNGRYGDVSILTCKGCRRRWIHYFAEYEAFTASGRWILGILPDDHPLPPTPENAVPILNTLPWYIYGGSAFHLPPPGRRARGDAPADLSASPGELVPTMKTRDYLVSQLQARGLWEWFLARFSKEDGTWEHEHGYDTGWRFSEDPPAIWYQQDVLMDPHEYGTTDRQFLASSDPDDQRIVDFMSEIGFEEHTTSNDEKHLPEVWPRFVPIDPNHIATLLSHHLTDLPIGPD